MSAANSKCGSLNSFLLTDIAFLVREPDLNSPCRTFEALNATTTDHHISPLAVRVLRPRNELVIMLAFVAKVSPVVAKFSTQLFFNCSSSNSVILGLTYLVQVLCLTANALRLEVIFKNVSRVFSFFPTSKTPTLIFGLAD